MAQAKSRGTGVKKLKPLIADSEIGYPQHEFLLRWVHTNRAAVVAWLFSKGDKWLEEQRALAEENAKESLEETLDALREGPAEGLEALKGVYASKLAELEQTVKALNVPALPPSIGDAAIEEWHQQVEVTRRVPAKSTMGHDRFEPAGFVDLKAKVSVAKGLYVSFHDSPPGWLGDSMWDVLERGRDKGATLTEKRKQELAAYNLGEPTWEAEKEEFTVLFDVRIDLPTTGELLRDLKTLRGLDAAKERVIVLVCEQMAEYDYDVLWGEGFCVLRQTDLM